MGASHHELKELLRMARRLGLQVEPLATGHHRITSPRGGELFVLAGTPGSKGAIKTARSKLRRMAP